MEAIIIRSFAGLLLEWLRMEGGIMLEHNFQIARKQSYYTCLSNLWKRSDAVYGIATSDERHKMRVMLCLLKMEDLPTPKDLARPFNEHFRASPRPPEVEDILGRIHREKA